MKRKIEVRETKTQLVESLHDVFRLRLSSAILINKSVLQLNRALVNYLLIISMDESAE